MKIYICTSTKNLGLYRRLRDELAPTLHFLFDWTPLLPPPGQDFELRKDDDPQGNIFDYCSRACASADLIVYIGPSGMDASFELGIAYASGVPVWGVGGPEERPGLMIRGGVSRWFPTVEELVLELTQWRGW